MEQVREAGATVVKEAQDTVWDGYSGYSQDPDGHLWAVVLRQRDTSAQLELRGDNNEPALE